MDFPILHVKRDGNDVFVCEDIERDLPPQYHEKFRQIGICSFIDAHMVVGKRTVGSVTLASPIRRSFTVSEVRLLRNISDLAAAAVERSRLYEEQLETAEQLREADNIKSRFLASMSHELRTPLNAVLNFSEFIAMGVLGPVTEKQLEALGKVRDSGRHLLALINDVLDMTKIESGMLKLFVEKNINIHQELKSVIDTTQVLLKDKNVTFIQEVESDLPLVVADKRRIRQVLLNLVSNAAKFTQEGTITLHVKKLDDMLRFGVIDTGPGIAIEDQMAIFEPFRQTISGIKHVGGTGLGLAISKKLVESHGGQLWVESEAGQGAAFYFTLPIQSSDLIAQLVPVEHRNV
jgi:signal transduction histidine kinase